MKKRNIISGIKQYRSEVDTNFHMPGHKGKAEILGELEKNLNFFDNKDRDVITKIISNFKYNKGFAFGFKGWADIRLVLVSLNEGFIATNKKGKEVIELYSL
jgi:hypothetical protein